MAEEEKTQEDPLPTPEKKKGGLPLIPIIVVVLIVLVGGGAFMMMGQESQIEEAKPLVEYVVKSKMYQLKDGAYLNLSFSIVVEEDKLIPVKDVLEKQASGRLSNGINMIVGNKSREDLINGTHKREAFSRELKKMLEERVFDTYNKKQSSTQDTIEVKEILLGDFVTQSG